MKVGKAKTTGQNMNDVITGEINGGNAMEGERGREHRKAWRIKKRQGGKREGRGREEEGDMAGSAEDKAEKWKNDRV